MAITNGYAELAELKAAAAIPDTGDDALLEGTITATSRAIDDYCGRRFYAGTETRYFCAQWPDRLAVPDLLALTSLRTDEDGDRTYEVTWDIAGADADVDLEPANAALDERPYWLLRVTPNGLHAFPVGVLRGVEVTGSWGCAFGTPRAAPAVVRRACLLQCQMDWQATLAAGQPAAGGGEYGQAVAAGLHPFVRRMLDPYRIREAV